MLVTGCSFVLTKGPPRPAANAPVEKTKPDCTDEMTWPAVDIGIAGISALAILVEGVGAHKAAAGAQALLGLAAAAGGYVGYQRVKKCRAARADWALGEMKGDHKPPGDAP